ncbi:hypothetical protein SteCoe_29029 [Stentor coeruleus]|uniref:Uncharacterized protein n=1 Tax=Stentor coeruleus TaxID=5963 RepID=A0A1R2B7C1_9CILI|nr:hypothetical protein SteCoe_29029 [Stentor coeruleus]
MVKKKNNLSSKGRLMNFYKRHYAKDKLAQTQTQKPNILVSTENHVNVHISQLYKTQDSISSFLSDSMLIETPIKSRALPLKPLYPSFFQELTEIKNNSFTSSKCQKDINTSIKDQDLFRKEQTLKAKEIYLNQLQNDIEKQEQIIKAREEELKMALKQISPNSPKSLSSLTEIFLLKSAILAQKEQELVNQEKNIEEKMKELEETKEEAIIMECSVCINEIIGCIVISDAEEKLINRYMQEDSEVDSFFYSFGNELDQIPEISGEHSSEYLNSSGTAPLC